MLRDFKFRRKIEEIENVQVNPNDATSNLTNLVNEVSSKSKFERTPVKSKTRKNPETPSALPLRTPERQGLRKRFGFSGVNEGGIDEGRSEMSNYLSKNGGRSLNLTPRVSGLAGKTTTTTTTTYSGYSESTTQTTPTKSVSKPPNPGYGSVVRRGGSYSALAKGFSGSVAHQHCVEVPHFDLKEDASFWMHHNVQVILRVRPLNNIERSTQGYNRCVKQDSAQSITWTGQPETRFTFDHVACETVDQEMLFRMAGRPIVENCLSGYNSCMFAYGQTGSGKTYTMLGDMEDVEFKPSSHCGMAPRIFEFLFARISSEEELRSDEKLKYNCRCSFLEIYNEQITDLLDPSSTNLLLREDVKNGVYVENISEFEVHTVGDVLRLLIQGSSNRRVAATNMNRESSRSHSVFTCIITSKWEKDSTTNQRFARLNLVDLAGSERQKSSGAEGERLKEAANINKSLSTLGHVIMLLVDIAHGKPKHVPYRDSRLTFLLQDSLGGNSKTMIIANISPSICCAVETLNTLKFAQRAKMIQNNAVVNEDSSGDVNILQHQILLLKEELSALKHQNNLSRALAFDFSCTARGQENVNMENQKENDQRKAEDLLGCDTKGGLHMSSKQFKSLELMLAGAMRREQMAESTIKKLEAEIEQLNRLVRQREEDTRSAKMQLKFREDKIQRMEALMGGLKPVDNYLLEENDALSEEIQLLRAKADRNPEVTRFAAENIRLVEQLRRFQDFYEEGEREILLQEVSELRSQLICSIDYNSQQHNHAGVQDATNNKENESIDSELTCPLNELEECQKKLQSCLETNAKLSRYIEDLQAHLRNKESGLIDHILFPTALKEMQAPFVEAQAIDEKSNNKLRDPVMNAEEIVNFELELDILKIILKEERVLRGHMEETMFSLNRDVQLSEEKVMLMRRQLEDAKADRNEAKLVIEALEAQQLLSISEIEDLKNRNNHYVELLHQQEFQMAAQREQRNGQESTFSSLKRSESKDSPLQLQLQRMQASLDKAKIINMLHQSDHATQRSNEEEMDAIRCQAEAESAEVIVCLQDKLSILQQRVQESDSREKAAEGRLLNLESNLKGLQETSDIMSLENEALRQSLLEKNMEIKSLVEDWELLSCEIEESLIDGYDALRNASDQLASIALSDRRGWVSEQFGKMIRHVSDKESAIEELNHCLEDANIRASEMEHMLMSLRGAVMVMTESHELVCYEKEKEILHLRAELMAHHLTEEEKTLMCEKKDCESKEIFDAGVLSLQAAFTDFLNTCEGKFLDLDHKLHTVEGCAQEVKSSWIQKKEILESQLVAAEEEILLCEKKDYKGKEIVEAGVLGLQAAFTDFQNICETKILALNDKVCKVGGFAQEAKSSWCQKKELLELQLLDAKAATAQNTIEASHLLARFEEAQDTIQEADMMINGLIIANETLKLQVEDLRNTNIRLISQRENLLNEIQEVQSASDLNNLTLKGLEKQLDLEVAQNMSLFEELRSVVSQVQDTSEEAFMSLTHDLNCIKSEICGNFKMMHSSIEDIWSQIFMKDCAFSVLHLCHMGVLLEAVTSLNAENGLLHHGLCESNAAIYDLRAHNMKSNEELEMCQLLKGKLLTDFKTSFDRILEKEGETKELNCKLDSFNDKLLVLQRQEELMLENSNFMNSELSSLMEELSQSNIQFTACLEEQEENFTVEWYTKDFELLILASELQELANCKSTMEGERIHFQAAMDYLMSEILALQITSDLKEYLMLERETYVISIHQRIDEAEGALANVLTQLHTLEAANMDLKQRLKMKDRDLENMHNGMFLLQTSSNDVQSKLLTVESENESLHNELLDVRRENSVMLEDIQGKGSELKSLMGFTDTLQLEKSNLQESISILESRIAFLEKDLEVKTAELDDFRLYQSSTAEALCTKSQDLESYSMKVTVLQEENLILRDEIQSLEQRNFEAHGSSSSKLAICATSMESAELQCCRMFKELDEKIIMVLDKMSEDKCQNLEMVSSFLKELEFVDVTAKDLVSQNVSLHEESLRKDEVVNGLQFDLRLLQESAANNKDLKDKIEELAAIVDSIGSELVTKSHELDEAVAFGQALEAKVKSQEEKLSALEMDLEKSHQSVNILSDENSVLRSQVENMMAVRSSLERELTEQKRIYDGLENELLEMGNTLGQVNDLVESLKNNLDESKNENDQLQKEQLILEEKLETAHALAEENDAVAAEAQEMAESRRIYAEEKEEEVQLLERSLQELDSTISVLENKVDVLKGEAEKQRTHREELELELQALKTLLLNVEGADAGIKRHFDEKSRNLQEALKRIQLLEKDLNNKDTEIAKCKSHISELNLHAEAQASTYKHKFKEMEGMIEQLKLQDASSHGKISSSNKLEKNASKGRGSASPFKGKGSGSPFKPKGSGSPFKCMGIGLVNQLKSEKDEEFKAERQRIEELEALAASRQKEIFVLNAKLATAESMTHDVIRDLVGVKLDMSSYAILLDKQKAQKIPEKALLVSSEVQEVNELKKQLNEFIEERQGWLEDINRKQAELVAVQTALDKYHQQEQLLTSANEALKVETQKLRKRVMELEGELEKVSGQQNFHQRIHHHAKIKEENNVLKVQNEDLCHRLRRAESLLSRIKEELAHYRACNGNNPHVNFDEEQRLKNTLKEIKEEKQYLAQTLLGLCTNILKAAGVTKPTSEVDLSAAEEALQKLVTQVTSLERELEDLKLKYKITNERVRLADLMPDTSSYNARSGDSRQTPRRAAQSPFFSALDR